MRFLTTSALCGVLSVCGWSQSTWKDLQFGSSMSEVEEQLLIAQIKTPAKTTATTAGFTLLETSTDLGEYKGKVLLRFSKERAVLDQIAINFSSLGPQDSACKVTTDHVVEMVMMFKAVSEALVAKYGPPATSASWPTPEELLLRMTGHTRLSPTAERIWKSGGQSIQQKTDFVCNSLFIVIVYRPLPTGL